MKRSQALAALCLTLALASTGCAGSLRQGPDDADPGVSSTASPSPTEPQVATSPSPEADSASSTQVAVTPAEDLIDVPAVEELLVAAVGSDASIRTPEMIKAEPARSRDGKHMAKYGQACVDTTAEQLQFDSAPDVELMTAMVSEESSINPADPPLTEVLSIRAFASEDDLAQSNELNEKSLEACRDDSSRSEQSHTERYGLPMTVITQISIMDSSFFEDQVTVQDLSANRGAMRIEYSTTPGSFVEAPLTTEEFIAEAGPRVAEVTNGL